MLHCHLKFFLVECFANFFYYKKRWKIKNVKKRKKRDKNKKRKKRFLHLWWKAVDLHVPRFNAIVHAHKKNYPREIRKLITKKRCLWGKCQTTPGTIC